MSCVHVCISFLLDFWRFLFILHSSPLVLWLNCVSCLICWVPCVQNGHRGLAFGDFNICVMRSFSGPP